MLSKIAEARFQKSARGCPVHPRQWRHTATVEARFQKSARGWIAHPRQWRHTATVEARFQKLARGWLAYPVTMVTCAATAEERL